ncbi:hypothetical protein [Thalassotalea sp. PS06]|uniref:hypothetical protein n=1 Tax=Thalassotalea sp. PS06 TaxID=2594005 RepID=UPI001163D863|nr:hypothetical protein [Thalassotalea sp. PS06]QDP01645.1 hypothetical protein FNC98_10040 [Thalassotalea sp. PS06]
MKLFQQIFFLLSFTLLTACGGDPLGEGESSNSSSGSGTSTGGGSSGGPEESDLTFSLSIDNTSISAANPAVVTATVLQNGDALSGIVVTFSSDLGEFDVESGTALTNSDGIATIGLTAGSVAGASTVQASFEFDGSSYDDSIGFETAGDQVSKIVLDLSVVEPNSTNEINVINTNSPGQIVANVIGVSEPVIVSFKTDIGVIPVTTAITDENNQAIVDIYAGDKLGAGTITASLNTGEQGQQLIVVGATNLYMGSENIDVSVDPMVGVGQAQLSIDPADLDAGATMSVSVKIVDENNVVYSQPLEVNFSSDCSSSGVALLSTPVTTIHGVATSTYRADGCIGPDTIIVSADVGGVSLSATAVVNVKPATTHSIEFISANPENVSLKGVGGTEFSIVKFKVLDINGNPVQGETVNFALNTDVGGINLDPLEAKTDAQGFVQTIVNAGNIATTVRVTASVVDANISTQSNLLVISTGIPDQDSVSISSEKFNLEGWNHDGEETAITVRLADAFNNPVPDGTAVSFTAEGGSIEPSCTTAKGACSVTFTSQNPRPDDGRISVLATAIGEESFVDLNGNGRYDNDSETAAEVVKFNEELGRRDIGEAFLDFDENGVYNSSANDVFIDFDLSGDYTPGDGTYTGSLCDFPQDNLTCSHARSLNVRGSLVLVMSSSAVEFRTIRVKDQFVASGIDDPKITLTGKEVGNLTVQIFDENQQQLPVGTKVKFAVTEGSILTEDEFTWPNSNSTELREFSVEIQGDDVAEDVNGIITITVTTPKQKLSTYDIPITILSE